MKKKKHEYIPREESNKEPAPSDRVDFFISKITESWNKQVESIIEVGKLLIQAKDELPHGQFTKMIEEQLPFGERTGQRLMVIAKHPIITNPTFVSVLPPSWATLHRLTELPEEELQQLLANKTINVETEREDVERIIEDTDRKGLYDFERIPKALNVLIAFMQKWPSAPRLGHRVLDDMLEGDDALNLEDVQKVSQWLGELYTVCKQKTKRDDEKDEEDMKRRDEDGKRRNTEVDSKEEAEAA